MHKVSIILAIVVVDSVVISEFVTSAPLRGTLDLEIVPICVLALIRKPIRPFDSVPV